MSRRYLTTLLCTAMLLGGCGDGVTDAADTATEAPTTSAAATPTAASPTPPSTSGTTALSSPAGDLIDRARQLAVQEQAPAAALADLAEIEEVVGTCDGGVQPAVIIRSFADGPDVLQPLLDQYAQRWTAAGWSPQEEDGEDGERTVSALTDDGVELQWTVAADATQSVGTLGVISPCTPASQLPAQPPLAEVIGRLEPLAIRAIERFVPADAWTADNAEVPCGDRARQPTLTLQGPTEVDPVEVLQAAAEGLPGQVTPLADRTVLADQGGGQLLVLSVRPGEVNVRAQAPCLRAG